MEKIKQKNMRYILFILIKLLWLKSGLLLISFPFQQPWKIKLRTWCGSNVLVPIISSWFKAIFLFILFFMYIFIFIYIFIYSNFGAFKKHLRFLTFLVFLGNRPQILSIIKHYRDYKAKTWAFSAIFYKLIINLS